MAEPEGKRVSDSYIEQVHIVQPEHLNHMQTLFGGHLMSWMDTIAGTVGSRHSGGGATMVAMDEMQIVAPGRLGDTLTYKARVTNVGRTSMEIFIEVEAEDADKNRRTISEAHVTTVGLGEDGRPAPVPPLIIETEEEQALWDAAEERKERRNSRRAKKNA